MASHQEELMIIAGWLFLGFVGTLLVWRLWTLTDKPFQRCPSPRVIAMCSIASVLGVAAWAFVIAAAIGETISWLDKKPKGESWWTRPLCK